MRRLRAPLLLELDEYAVRGGRMHERHQRPLRPFARRLVDEPDPALPETGEGRLYIVDPQRDVVKSGPPAGYEAPESATPPTSRFEQLERGRADAYEVRAHPLRRDLFRRVHLEPRAPV